MKATYPKWYSKLSTSETNKNSLISCRNSFKMLLYGKYLLPLLLQLWIEKQTPWWLTYQHTRQGLTMMLQRHSVLAGVSTAWLETAQPTSQNEVCTEYASVLPAWKGSSALWLSESLPLWLHNSNGTQKAAVCSLAMSLAPVVSEFTGELILFICCDGACEYPKNILWALASTEARRQAGFRRVKE